MGGMSPDALKRDAALRKFRAGRVIIETAPSGARRSWNPDRRERKAICLALGITTGRQWKRYQRERRLEQRIRREARR